MDVQVKTLRKNLNLVKCLNDKATKKFNKIVYNILFEFGGQHNE